MDYDKGIISELGFDPVASSKEETSRVLTAFELETVLIVNGWKVDHRTRFMYSAKRTIKDKEGKLHEQKIKVDFHHVRVYQNSGIPIVQQLIQNFDYYEWFDR